MDAGDDSDYDKVLAIQQHFHSDGFHYSTDVDVADDADALLTFLTQTKAGFCQQYATAMAVMVRELGLPARVAVGYQAGTLQDDGRYLVQTEDAHAWVEVFFEGYGWLQFEPTPGHGTHPNADPGTYLNPVKSSTNPDGTTTNPDDPNDLGGAGGAACVAAADLSPRERQLRARSRTGPSEARATSSRSRRSGPPRRGRVGVFGAVPADLPRAADRARRAPHRGADREVRVAAPAPASLARTARARPGGLPGVRRGGRRPRDGPPRGRDARRAPRAARRGDRVHRRAPRTAHDPGDPSGVRRGRPDTRGGQGPRSRTPTGRSGSSARTRA